MARATPSQVVNLIDALIPSAKEPPTDGIRLGSEYSPHLFGILNLARDIPQELLQLSGSDYSDLVLGLAGLEYMIRTWESRGDVSLKEKVAGSHPVVLVRRSLAKCRDESPTPGTTELSFISDKDLRESIRLDVSSAGRNLHDRNWKASTVLSGAAAEALLLWALQAKAPSSQLAAATAALVSTKVFRSAPHSNPEHWNLHEYIEVAEHLKLVSPETAQQARLAKDFRNLIHPGRAARLGRTCDRGSALSALAAVELIARDLM